MVNDRVTRITARLSRMARISDARNRSHTAADDAGGAISFSPVVAQAKRTGAVEVADGAGLADATTTATTPDAMNVRRMIRKLAPSYVGKMNGAANAAHGASGRFENLVAPRPVA